MVESRVGVGLHCTADICVEFNYWDQVSMGFASGGMQEWRNDGMQEWRNRGTVEMCRPRPARRSFLANRDHFREP